MADAESRSVLLENPHIKITVWREHMCPKCEGVIMEPCHTVGVMECPRCKALLLLRMTSPTP